MTFESQPTSACFCVVPRGDGKTQSQKNLRFRLLISQNADADISTCSSAIRDLKNTPKIPSAGSKDRVRRGIWDGGKRFEGAVFDITLRFLIPGPNLGSGNGSLVPGVICTCCVHNAENQRVAKQRGSSPTAAIFVNL